ncbi:NAD/NADP-dependent betaine aldehyde dehydrogenase (plasmid) [Shinella zoogloeoides]|nr:NAD/NADP-dependent betaine aldehyde dehydrogenase [Shinella zoogloeoides]
MFGNFYSTGQACSNGTRVFVQKGTKDKFLSRVKERTKKILIGDPMDEATQLGPMVFKAQRDKALDYIEKGKPPPIPDSEFGQQAQPCFAASTSASFECSLQAL